MDFENENIQVFLGLQRCGGKGSGKAAGLMWRERTARDVIHRDRADEVSA